MRTVRYSKSFAVAFDALLAHGEQQFGPELIRAKRGIVKDTIERFLAVHPGAK